MSNPNPTRLSPAELRRRLLAPPPDTSTPVVPEEEVSPPAMATRLGHRRTDASRFGGAMATQVGIDLDALAQEVPAPPSFAKLTPLPESRLDPAQFRSRDGSFPFAQAVTTPSGPIAAGDEAEGLRIQNAELSRIIDEMRPLLEEASAQEHRFQKKEQDLHAALADKDRQVEELTAKVKQVEEQLSSLPAPKVPKTNDELEEWSDELEKESAKLTQDRRRLDEDRRQLREDEESLEKQMREMECSMARERAMMARQETELKRLSAEIQHELDLLQRGDGTLREQLSKFQRRHQEVLARGASGPPPAPLPETPIPPPAPAPAPAKDSGLFRRIFRGK